jgi:ParB family transcriptional regulator, chromosome partitioning protein
VSAVETIDIDLIDLGVRLRPVDEAAIPALAASIKNEGLLQAIGLVRSGQLGKRFTLIWGAHRLAAVRHLGMTTISARVYAAKDLPDGVSVTELEALENLSRAELSPYDRAMTVKGLRAEMLRAAGLEKGQDARTVGGFAKDDSTESVNLTVSDIAIRLGVSKIAVERDLALAKNLQSALATAARGRDGWRNASVVTACAKLAVEQQMQLIGWLSANLEGSLKNALGTLAPDTVSTPSDKATKAVLGNFERVRTQDRVAVVGQLCQALTPGQRKELLVALDAAWQEDAKQALAGNAVGGDA